MTQHLQKLLPKIRFVVGHGQMPENDLEEVMHDFINHRADVLVCTTIVENGVDIPNANTIIIDKADTFGLSQLYQLRGRVGRSDLQAFCYLMYDPEKSISETAMKRLNVINDYTDLGAGFKIAMHDLEIRGAGNVLGAEQSGDISSIGFEMYCQLLEQAIQELEGEEIKVLLDPWVEISYEGYIPDEYVPDTSQKVEMYKKLARCMSTEDVLFIVEEFKDRFGPIPEKLATMIKVSNLKARAKDMQLLSIIDANSRIRFKMNGSSKINQASIPRLFSKYKEQVIIKPDNPNEVQLWYDSDFELQEKLDFIHKFLDFIEAK